VLEAVVDQREEAQLPAPLPRLAPLVDLIEQVADVRADRPLRVSLSGLAPSPALPEGRIGGQGVLEIVLGLETGYRRDGRSQPTTCADQ